MSRKFSQKSQKTEIIKAKLKKQIITLVVDFHSSTTYLQSQTFLTLVTTLKYFFQSVRKILSGPGKDSLILKDFILFLMPTILIGRIYMRAQSAFKILVYSFFLF